MNPEPIDLLFRPEAPSSFLELDENDHGPIVFENIGDWGEIVASVTTGVNIPGGNPFTTVVVQSVWGLRVGSDVHYQVMSDIGPDDLHEPTTRKSAAPLTLGELYDFLMGAVHLFEGEDNLFEVFKHGGFIQLERGNREQSQFLQFFEVDSDFYPDLDRLVRQRFIERWG